MTTATLHDGTTVDTYSEQWRAYTEAMHVLTFSKAAKGEFMEMVRRKRGEAGVDSLQRHMDEIEHGYVLDRLSGQMARRAYFEQVEFDRGPNVRSQIEGRVLALWKSRQVVAPSVQAQA